MKTKKALSALLAGAVVGAALLAPTGAAQAKKAKVVVVGEDPEGDWGSNVEPALGPVGGPLSQDLLSASIGMADKATINFIIQVSALPPNGGVPEATRYTWNMAVDGEQLELDGKWSNYMRGACDPTTTPSTCPPPRDPGMQPFQVRGNCFNNGAAVACEELGIVKATFDAGAGTITVPVPLELIGAKAGSQIVGATQADSTFSGVSAMPSAFYSLANLPYDTLMVTKAFTIPK